jgi:hypothetical protein
MVNRFVRTPSNFYILQLDYIMILDPHSPQICPG